MRASNHNSAVSNLVLAVLFTGLAAGCGDPKKADLKAPGPSTPAAAKKAASAPSVDTNAAPASGLGEKSVFEVDPQKVKDPFFPTSKRVAVTPVVTNGVPAQAPVKLELPALLSVTGISERSKMAIVNGAILEEGKKTEITVSVNGLDQKLTVRCLSIAKGVVRLAVEGERSPIELRLRR